MKLGFSFDDGLYEKIFKEIYPLGYDDEVSVDTKKKMSVANKYDITVSEVTEIINYFRDGKNISISHIIVGNPSGTAIATTTEIVATKADTTVIMTTITTKDTTKFTTREKTGRTTNDGLITNTYVLNTNTMKFHYASCRDVDKIIEENYSTFDGSRDEVIAMGYDSCGHCNP